MFNAIAQVTEAAGQQSAQASAQPAPQPGAQPATAAPPAVPPGATTVSPSNLLWLGATVLLLGTVGVLVTARIILALMLAMGPVFVVLALFPATRGLFVGWLRATVLSALAPLLAVVGGAFTLELAVPTVSRLAGPEGIEARGAMAFFLIAAVHATLMVMALRTCGTIVGAWRVFPGAIAGPSARPASDMTTNNAAMAAAGPASARMSSGPGVALAGLPPPTDAGGAPGSSSHSRRFVATAPVAGSDGSSRSGALPEPRRAAGIGSRFRAAPARQRLAG